MRSMITVGAFAATILPAEAGDAFDLTGHRQGSWKCTVFPAAAKDTIDQGLAHPCN